MKEATLEQFTRDVKGFVTASQGERVLLTENGKPLALIVGIEHKDAEDLELEASPEFWRMIEERRSEPTISLEELKAEIFGRDE